MTFISLVFLVFFMTVTLWFFQLRRQQERLWLLLVAGCYFYMCLIPAYMVILAGIILVDYLAGLKIDQARGNTRKWWLALSLFVNMGTLALFKYYNFFCINVEALSSLFGKNVNLPLLQMALPLGLSFHTFQAMSYNLEVYRKKCPAEKSLLAYSLYVMFYPQLVAGPIERPYHLLPQLKEFRPYNQQNVREGISQMLWGFFKKAVIADRLALVVDQVYAHYGQCSSLALAVSAIFYSFQIYCDFSGYSDIAIGAAKVMNIRLMENFNQPYLSTGPGEFWNRWHISLSSWFRDYVYIPLGGNRVSKTRRYFNVIIVFLLSGLWHGARWTFVVWGLLHGLLYFLLLRKKQHHRHPRIIFIIHAVCYFLVVTLFWIFFRAPSLGLAINYIKTMCSFHPGTIIPGQNAIELALSILLISALLFREKYLPSFIIQKNRHFWIYVCSMVTICYFLGVFRENQFIYFQF